MTKTKLDIKTKKEQINQKHIDFYDKALEILEYILNEYSRELIRADIDYIDIPKNTTAILDFLISSIGRIQKGHRLALGLDNLDMEDTAPKINIIEGLSENKI